MRAGKRPEVRYIRRVEPAADAHWIFAYGSLMWDPGFAFAEVRPALLRGYHRALCIYSHHYRGTAARPGLVLGLDAGGACRGLAYRVAAAEWETVRAYLFKRELLNGVYTARQLPLRLAGEGAATVRAQTFIVNRCHPQYAGKLPLTTAAELVAQGCGVRGRCHDYLANTVAHLDALGLPDGPLHALLAQVEARKRSVRRPPPDSE